MRAWSIACLLLISVAVSAQPFTADPSQSKVLIKGTSTLKDWVSVLQEFSLRFVVKGGVIDDLEFTAPVRSIKSNWTSMDEKTMAAMNADRFPLITFSGSGFKRQGHAVTGEGNLTVAGVPERVQVQAEMGSWVEGELHVVGQLIVRMTDHGITPPTAVMGSIRTGNEVTLEFNFILRQ